jgi:hypothetical protein
MSRMLRCQLRPGAGKSLCGKSPSIAPRRVASSRAQCVSPAGTLGLSPAEPQGRRVNHAYQSFRTAIKWCGRRYPCPRRCSEFLPLSLRNLFAPNPVICPLPASTGEPKNFSQLQANPVPVHGCRVKTDTCGEVGELDGRKVYRLPTLLSCRLLPTTAGASDFQPHREARAGTFRQIFGSREAAVELGDQLHDVQAEPEVWAVVAAGA